MDQRDRTPVAVPDQDPAVDRERVEQLRKREQSLVVHVGDGLGGASGSERPYP